MKLYDTVFYIMGTEQKCRYYLTPEGRIISWIGQGIAIGAVLSLWIIGLS